MTAETAAAWIELDGAVNVRDVAGMPTADGRTVQPNRLIRSDNLQNLSAADVRLLVDEAGVRTVADLRTGVEVEAEGPGPLTREELVEVRHLSLWPESGTNTDVAADGGTDGDPAGKPVILPWQDSANSTVSPDGEELEAARRRASEIYVRYLVDRPDSVLAALRLIAYSPGATIVHCAAGKDRTGTIVALALLEVGVERAAVVADYVRTGERIERVFARLSSTRTYGADVKGVMDPAKHAPKPETMEKTLDAVEEQFGGVHAWLLSQGWTEEDEAALRAKLLG